MEGFVRNIEKSTEDNTDFRRVLYTGKHLQLVLMALRPKARNPKNLEGVNEGDLVELTYTRALAIALDKSAAK